MKVLVAGTPGFIGSTFSLGLLEREDEACYRDKKLIQYKEFNFFVE